MNKTPGIKLKVLFLKQIMIDDEKIFLQQCGMHDLGTSKMSCH